MGPPSQCHPCHSVRGTPVTVSPKPSLEPSLEPLNKNYNKKIWFDEFWEVYPRKTGKIEAERKFESALKKAEPEHIIEGPKQYAAQVKDTDPQFIARPRTWLHHGRWADEDVSTAAASEDVWAEVNQQLVIGK